MKERLLNILRGLTTMLLVALYTSVSAQEDIPSIDLTFTALGDATTVESVIVTNISRPEEVEPLTISGTDVLRLVSKDIITPIENIEQDKGITQPILTPNPSLGDGTLIFDVQEEGPVHISIYTDNGMLVDVAKLNASKGRNTARIPSQGTGIYIVKVEGRGIKASTRWICGGSKSFSSIALGGAGQWADVILPVKFKDSKPTRAAEVREQFMEFNEGDILRFDGRSGQMRTIMHLTPETSGAVNFDFYRCQDANGYNYPIVRSGDMLWMLEDLRPQNISGVTRTTMPSLWKSIASNGPAELVTQSKAYYNIDAARMALPEGWRMPSIDEVHAYIKSLEANSYNLGDFMKDRSYNWPGTMVEGPDTIHLQLQPNGFVDNSGKFTEVGTTGAFLTRNTINHGNPVTFEVRASNAQLHPQVEHGKGFGFAVRGCRTAPSVYQKMITRLFMGQSGDDSQPMQLVNGPLGAYYSFARSDRKAVFFDYSFNQFKTNTYESRSGVFGDFGEGSKLISKGMVPQGINGADYEAHLRKVAAQGNADGYENIVYASWSKPYRVFLNWGSFPQIQGNSNGTVNVTIFGDATKNHEILDGYNGQTLLDADGNPYQWYMPYLLFSQVVSLPYTTYEYNGFTYDSDIRTEFYSRIFNLKCIQDQTGDGVDEIVMSVGGKLAIFNGVTLHCIREREFHGIGPDASNGITPGTIIRFDVADADNDGYEDLVVLSGDDESRVYIFSQGHIDEEPTYATEYFQDILLFNAFFDIKVGDFSGSPFPDIALLYRGIGSNKTSELGNQGYLCFYRLEYAQGNETSEAQRELTLKRTYFTTCKVWGSNELLRHHMGNMDLCFAYFRGRQYHQDLIVGSSVWRYNSDKQRPEYLGEALKDAGEAFQPFSVPADAITAVRLHENTDKESVIFFYKFNDCWGNSNSDHNAATISTMGECYLDNNGAFKVSIDLNTNYFGWWNNSPYTDLTSNKNWEMTEFAHLSSGIEKIANPVICTFNDREQAKHFRYVNHEVTLSEPRIAAAIAAAPYYMGLEDSDDAETAWGNTTSSSSSEVTSDTWGGSVIVGYEYEFSMPFFSSMNAGVEFEAKVNTSATTAHGEENVVSHGWSVSAKQNHMVLMQATPYDTYTYEITESREPDDIGMTFQVSMPRTRSFVPLRLQDYMQLMGNQKHVAKPQRVLTATPGDPWSYPANYDNAGYIIRNNSNYPFLAGLINNKEEGVTVGTGGSFTRSISLAKNVSDSKTVEIGTETELVVKAGGAKAGVGFNYNHSNESTRTIGSELMVEGRVPGLPSLSDDYPQFKWNIVWYYVKDGKETYPVVNYTVTNP